MAGHMDGGGLVHGIGGIGESESGTSGLGLSTSFMALLQTIGFLCGGIGVTVYQALFLKTSHHKVLTYATIVSACVACLPMLVIRRYTVRFGVIEPTPSYRRINI